MEVSYLGGRMNWNRCRNRDTSGWLDREEERQRMPDRWSLRDSIISDVEYDFSDDVSEEYEEKLDPKIALERAILLRQLNKGSYLTSEKSRKASIKEEIHKNRSLKDMRMDQEE